MELMTVEEAATATRMSKSWWRQQIFSKKIRHLKVGRRVLIPAEVVDKLLAGAVVEPTSPRQTKGRG